MIQESIMCLGARRAACLPWRTRFDSWTEELFDRFAWLPCGTPRNGRAESLISTDYDLHYTVVRQVELFEALKSDQIANLVRIAEKLCFSASQEVLCQGEEGHHLYIVLSGELVAVVAHGNDVQEHRKYRRGDVFGERALLSNARRAATVRATTSVELLSVSRRDFEKHLGPLTQVRERQYMLDPRRCLAEFFMPGDRRGPKGVVSKLNGNGDVEDEVTSWFAVYRPTSRDAIASMLQRVAVGKGLNVKGKSSKKGLLSGFVPFLQISDNSHKDKIEVSPPGARLQVFYRTVECRDLARCSLMKMKDETHPTRLRMQDPSISNLDDFCPKVWGLEVPEPLFREAYIMRPNIEPDREWETGRVSEPTFMNMNLHTVRGDSTPKVVVLQWDLEDAMNPCALLVAYAEESVKPVVSDFDTFLVGSRNMPFSPPLPAEQIELSKWSLIRTGEILKKPSKLAWTSRWLEIVSREMKEGRYPNIPPCGFGDPTSYSMTESVIAATLSSGAVRHGAECFNFWFPQELDVDYLIIWEGFPDQPWEYVSEPKLREFLLQRAKEGFCFPLNPVWTVRDEGWYEVLEALLEQCKESSDQEYTFHAFFPPQCGIFERIEHLRLKYPNGLAPARRPAIRRKSSSKRGDDCDSCEAAELGMHDLDLIRKRLFDEVRTGRSKFNLGADGVLLRYVAVVVLALADSNNRMLVQVWDTGVAEDVRYRLPGQKLREGETQTACLRRMIEAKLGLQFSEVTMIKDETKTVLKQSEQFLCKTQYSRHIFQCSLDADSSYLTQPHRLRLTEEEKLEYEIKNSNGESEWLPLQSAEGSCPLEDQVSASEENDFVIDDNTDCELFAIQNTDEPDRLIILSWMDPTLLATLGDGGYQPDYAEREKCRTRSTVAFARRSNTTRPSNATNATTPRGSMEVLETDDTEPQEEDFNLELFTEFDEPVTPGIEHLLSRRRRSPAKTM